jgi:hypothetical protein
VAAATDKYAASKTTLRPKFTGDHRVVFIDKQYGAFAGTQQTAYFGLADGLKDGKETVGAFSAPAALVKYAFGLNPTSPAYSTVGKDLTITL